MHTALRRKDYYSMAKIRAAVLFGGVTKDHKISLVSAHSILTGLSPEKYDITPIGITKAGRWLYFPGDYCEIKDGTWENNSDCCSAIIRNVAIAENRIASASAFGHCSVCLKSM